MSGARLYLTGTVIITGVTAWVARYSNEPLARVVWLALALGLMIQAPLGWWLIRAIGTKRFLGIWSVGILVRFALVGVVTLAILPALHWPIAPGAFATLIVLLAFLVLEVIVLLVDRSRTEAR